MVLLLNTIRFFTECFKNQQPYFAGCRIKKQKEKGQILVKILLTELEEI